MRGLASSTPTAGFFDFSLIQINGIPPLQWNNSPNATVSSVYGSDTPVVAQHINGGNNSRIFPWIKSNLRRSIKISNLDYFYKKGNY
jgi:hypothetical protein